MNYKLKLAFYRPRSWVNFLPLIVVISAAIGLAWQIAHYQQLMDQKVRQQARLTQAPVLTISTPTPSEQERTQYQRLNQVVEQLNRPMLQLHAVLATASHPDVVVLAIDESGKGGSASLIVEAKTNAALQAYWDNLNRLPQFTSVRLMERTQRIESNYSITRATFLVEDGKL